MERNDYNGGFEHFLKDKADQHKLYPSDRVWNAINNRLHRKSRWPYLVVAAIFLGLGIGGKIFDSSLIGQAANNNDSRSLNVLDQDSPEASPASPQESVENEGSTSRSGIKLVHANPDLNSLTTPSSARAVKSTLKAIPGGKYPSAALQGEEGVYNYVPEGQNDRADDTQIENGHQIETMNLLINNHVHDLATITTIQNKSIGKPVTETRKAPKTTAIKVLKPYKDKFGLQFYMSPTISYRKLFGDGIRTYGNGQGSSFNFSSDVNTAVTHKPLIGTEVGAALVFNMNKKLRFKTGLQLNLNQYEALAFENTAELVPMTAAGLGHTQVNAMSTFRSSGTNGTWLRNQRIMIAIPVGAEWSVYNSRNVQFNIAGSIQPTYAINNSSYMVSSDLKNYAQAPSLYRHFNMNTSVEAFLSVKSGSLKWSIGPQLRYQMLSSFKKEYPISEHLLDYGFKVGVTKTLK